MYGPAAGTRINPCVPVLPLASTIQGEGSRNILLVGAGPPGQDTDRHESLIHADPREWKPYSCPLLFLNGFYCWLIVIKIHMDIVVRNLDADLLCMFDVLHNTCCVLEM